MRWLERWVSGKFTPVVIMRKRNHDEYNEILSIQNLKRNSSKEQKPNVCVLLELGIGNRCGVSLYERRGPLKGLTFSASNVYCLVRTHRVLRNTRISRDRSSGIGIALDMKDLSSE